MIYVISVAIFILGILLCSIKGKSYSDCRIGWLKRILNVLSKEDYNSYFSNFIVTILGVTCAILLTNYDTRKQETNQTIVLLNYLSEEIVLADQFLNDELNDVLMGYKDESMIESMKNVQFPPMFETETLLTTDPYQSTISIFGHNALNEFNRNINTLKNDIEDSNDIREIENSFRLMSYEFEYLNGIINLEIMYQNKKINYDQYYDKVCELINNVFGEENFYNTPTTKIYYE